MGDLVNQFVIYLEPYIGYAYAHFVKHSFILIAGIFIGIMALFCFHIKLWVGVRTKEDIGDNLLAVRTSYKNRSAFFVAPSNTFIELFNINLALISLKLSKKDNFKEKDLRKARFLFFTFCVVVIVFVYIGISIALDVNYLPHETLGNYLRYLSF